MKIFAISGSRNPEGQTAQALHALLDGAREAGCETDEVFLPNLQVERCRQCNDQGWGRCAQEAQCCIEDDLAGLVERIREADLIVFANPTYFGDLSESLRAFFDRLRRICIHGAKKDRIEGKPAVGVCVAGGGGGGAPKNTVSLEYALATCGFDVVDLIPARRQNLSMKLEMLPIVGRWLATVPTSN